jgi:hypothetical protein
LRGAAQVLRGSVEPASDSILLLCTYHRFVCSLNSYILTTENERRDPLIKDRLLPRPLFCPICRSAVLELDRTGDATGYACATHGNFKVTDTVFAQRAKDYTREQWEAALRKAKQRTKSGEMPVIN